MLSWALVKNTKKKNISLKISFCSLDKILFSDSDVIDIIYHWRQRPDVTDILSTLKTFPLSFFPVACSTVTVTKCQAALRTLQAFPFFRPTCLCKEPGVDPDCNYFRDFLFDHPCGFVLKKGKYSLEFVGFKI